MDFLLLGDDILLEGYPYEWSKDSSITLQEFLNKYKPSMVQDDGTKPWLWVRKGEPEKDDVDREGAVKEATVILQDITAKVQSIKDDASIPARSSKKTGAKGKKEVREEAQAEATARLKEAAIKHGYVSGKWLIFASPDRVDSVWSTVANSLVSGPLSSTSAYLAKVATCPRSETANPQRLICIYLPNVYDKDKVTEVMKVLLRKHGLTLSGVKSNLYTDLGLDSKHASGLQSTTWKNAALMTDAEMKELKDAHYAERNNKPAPEPKASAAPAAAAATADSDEVEIIEAKPTKPSAATKGKPRLKKGKDDPFASDDDGEVKATKPSAPAKKAPIKKSTAAKRKQTESDESEEDRPKKKFTV